MTRQQIALAIAAFLAPIVQVIAYKFLIAPLGLFIERRLRRWPRLLRFLTKPRLSGWY